MQRGMRTGRAEVRGCQKCDPLSSRNPVVNRTADISASAVAFFTLENPPPVRILFAKRHKKPYFSGATRILIEGDSLEVIQYHKLT